jgi:DNA-binding NarL/FixJ family response regulator
MTSCDDPLVIGPCEELIADGQAALRIGDGATARQRFERALAIEESAVALEGMARACYLERDFHQTIDLWERSYGAYRATGDAKGAVRVARSLAYAFGTIVGDAAVMGGWLARAQSLLGDTAESSESGWIELNRGMFEGDRQRKDAHFRAALDVARRFGDTDLEFDALAYLGASLVHGDRIEEGMVLLDEALAAVAGHEVDDIVVFEDIFCQLFSACEHAQDVTRADQWIRVGEAIAERRNLPAVSAFCHSHYGGILTTAGRWSEADAALSEAVRMWGLGQRSWFRAGALTRLADLRVRQGRFEEAEQLLASLEVNVDLEAARPRAAIHLARSETSLARETLERALDEVEGTSTQAAPLLSLLVDVHLAAGDLEDADRAASALAECARGHPAHHSLQAAAALARGRVCLASGTGDPQACLREALAGFARAQMPMELARSRLELATALATDRPEVALAEARRALDGFERLQAARDADEAAALLRSLGVRTPSAARTSGVLTKREAEVLELLGHGLSNPEISDRLFISRKTVEHHVGNILAKLGLRNRGEAAAYAVRKQGTK